MPYLPVCNSLSTHIGRVANLTASEPDCRWLEPVAVVVGTACASGLHQRLPGHLRRQLVTDEHTGSVAAIIEARDVHIAICWPAASRPGGWRLEASSCACGEHWRRAMLHSIAVPSDTKGHSHINSIHHMMLIGIIAKGSLLALPCASGTNANCVCPPGLVLHAGSALSTSVLLGAAATSGTPL